MHEDDDLESILARLRNDTRLYPHGAVFIPHKYLLDRESAKKILEINGKCLTLMPHFQNDREMVSIAVKTYGLAISDASPEFRKDYELCWDAIKNDDTVIKMLPELAKDKTFCIKACVLNPKIFTEIAPELQEDMDVILPMLNYGFASGTDCSGISFYVTANATMLNNREAAQLLIKRNVDILQLLDNDDDEYASLAMEVNPADAYRLLSDRLKHKKEFIEKAKHSAIISDFPKDVLRTLSKEECLDRIGDKGFNEFEFRKNLLSFDDIPIDREMVLALVENKSSIPHGYGDDEEIVLKALRFYWQKEQYDSIAPELKESKDFVLKGMDENCNLYNYIPRRLQEDKDVVIAYVKNQIRRLEPEEFFDEIPERFRHDQDVISIFIENSPDIWDHLSEDMKTRENFILAIKSGLKDSNELYKAGRRDREVIETLMEHPNGNAAFYILSHQLLTDKNIRHILENGGDITALPGMHCMRRDKEAILTYYNYEENRRYNPRAIRYCDMDVALAVVKSYPYNYEQLPKEFKENPEVKEAAINALFARDDREWEIIPFELQTKEMLIDSLMKTHNLPASKFLSPELRLDEDVAELAYKLNKDNIHKINPELWEKDSSLNRMKGVIPQAELFIERKEFLEIFDKTNEAEIAKHTAKAKVERVLP